MGRSSSMAGADDCTGLPRPSTAAIRERPCACLTGLVAGFDWETELVGDASLSSRPMDRVAEPLGLMGATVTGQGSRCQPPLRVRGGALHGIDWTAKVASAQVKSAILLAGLSASGTTVVREAVTTRTHTEEMLTEAGADITVEPWGEGRVVRVRASSLRPVERTVPGDPSASAFFVVAGCVVPGSAWTSLRVYSGPARLGYVSVLERMGAPITLRAGAPGTTTIRAMSGPLRGHRGAGAAKSRRSTRFRLSPSPPPSPRAPRSSPTSVNCGSRRSTGWRRWPTWSRPSAPGPPSTGTRSW